MGVRKIYNTGQPLLIAVESTHKNIHTYIRTDDEEPNPFKVLLVDATDYKRFKLTVERVDIKEVIKNNFIDPSRSDEFFKLTVVDDSTLNATNVLLMRLNKTSLHFVCKDYWTLLKNSFNLDKPEWVEDIFDSEGLDPGLKSFLRNKYSHSGLSLSENYGDYFFCNLNSRVEAGLNLIINGCKESNELNIIFVDDEDKFNKELIKINKQKNKKTICTY